MEALSREFGNIVENHNSQQWTNMQSFISNAYRSNDYGDQFRQHHNQIFGVFDQLEGIQAQT